MATEARSPKSDADENSRTGRRGVEIVDMLAAEGMTYGEAHLVLRSAEWELGERKNKETVSKMIKK